MFRWVKKIDALGAVLLAVLVALAIGAVYAALHFGWFRSPWELAAVLFVGGCFVAFGLSTQGAAAAAAKPRSPRHGETCGRMGNEGCRARRHQSAASWSGF